MFARQTLQGGKTELLLESRDSYAIVQNSSMHKTVKALLTFHHSHAQLVNSLISQTWAKIWVHESLFLHLEPQTVCSKLISPPSREWKGHCIPLLLNRTLDSIQVNQVHLKAFRKHNHCSQSAADPLLSYRIRLHSSYKQCISKHNKKQGVPYGLWSMFMQVCYHQNREENISISLEYVQEKGFFRVDPFPKEWTSLLSFLIFMLR